MRDKMGIRRIETKKRRIQQWIKHNLILFIHDIYFEWDIYWKEEFGYWNSKRLCGKFYREKFYFQEEKDSWRNIRMGSEWEQISKEANFLERGGGDLLNDKLCDIWIIRGGKIGKLQTEGIINLVNSQKILYWDTLKKLNKRKMH
jgi:hypothetical protein